jgi:hypothetical protein
VSERFAGGEFGGTPFRFRQRKPVFT